MFISVYVTLVESPLSLAAFKELCFSTKQMDKNYLMDLPNGYIIYLVN
jgi:hypothetical protein